MRKIFALFLALLMLFSLSACGSNVNEEASSNDKNVPSVADDGDKKPFATEFSFTVKENEDIVMENLIFEKDVTVNGDYGAIAFVNCEFRGNITSTASFGTKVILEGSTVDGQCIIQHDGKEGTIETPLPKFVFDAPIDAVYEDCFGNFIALGDFEFTVNGTPYSIEKAEYYYADGLVPYEGQEASCIWVSQWWENGEHVLIAAAE